MLALMVIRVVTAQFDCPQLAQRALEMMDDACAETGRNEACYGHFQVEASPLNGVDIQFHNIGDVEQMENLGSIKVSGYDVASQIWGVALMRLQASLPHTLPGQNVTFLLMGDVEISSALRPESGAAPMQAFYLKTGIGSMGCEDAPPDGLLIQTPRGAGQVSFSVNGVDMHIGSTVFLEAGQAQTMRVTTLEGSAAVEHDAQTYPVLAGSRAEYLLGEDMQPVQARPVISTYRGDPAFKLDALPFHVLDEAVEPDQGMDGQQLQSLLEHWEAHGTVCMPGMACENIIAALGGGKCALDVNGAANCQPPGSTGGWEVIATPTPLITSAQPAIPHPTTIPVQHNPPPAEEQVPAPPQPVIVPTVPPPAVDTPEPPPPPTSVPPPAEETPPDENTHPGDFGCERPGNYCNAPGHNKDKNRGKGKGRG